MLFSYFDAVSLVSAKRNMDKLVVVPSKVRQLNHQLEVFLSVIKYLS